MATSFLIGGCGFLAYFGIVVMLLRWLRQLAPAVVAVGAAVAVYGSILTLAMLFDIRLMFWPLSATFWFLAICYLMLFGAMYKSVSLRILCDLLERPGRCERQSAILARYIENESFANRIAVLLASSWGIERQGGIELTDKGRKIAAVVGWVQRQFRIERSG